MFLVLSRNLTNEEFFSYGWRIPFLASAVLVLVGLYVRLTITETPVFREALSRSERVKVPMVVVFRDYPRTLVIGIMVSLATFVLFYLMTVFALAWGTSALGYSRERFLVMQLFGVLFFGAGIGRSGSGGTRTPAHVDLGDRGDWRLRPGNGADVLIGPDRALLTLVVGLSVDGPDVRTARNGAFGALSDVGPLHRQLADVQPGRHLRRLAGPVYRHVAGHQLRPAVCRLLPLFVRGCDACRAPRDA